MFDSFLAFFCWRKSNTVTKGEWRVISEILKSDDPRVLKCRKQIAKAPYVRRRRVGRSSYQLTIPHTDPLLLVPLEQNLNSRPVYVADQITLRELRFELLIQKTGLIGPLIGSTNENEAWPYSWEVDPTSGVQRKSNEPCVTFPNAKENVQAFRRFGEWLDEGDFDSLKEELLACLPANEWEISSAEKRERIEFPIDYKEFLSTTNGLIVGDTCIFGTPDVYALSEYPFESVTFLVIADLREEGVLGMPVSGPRKGRVVHYPPGSQGVMLSETLRGFVKQSARKAIEGAR